VASRPRVDLGRDGWGRGGRFGEEVTLGVFGAVGGEPAPLFLGLDAFDDDGHPELVGELDELARDRRAVRVAAQPLREADVQLYEVRAQGGEEVQRAVVGAQVVEGHPEAAPAVVGQDPAQLPAVSYLVALGELEDDLLGREARPFCGLQRAPQAVPGIVDGGGVEVDKDAGEDPVQGGPFYGLEPRRPVEVDEQARPARHLEHRTRAHQFAAPPDAAQQALVGEDLVWLRHGDDGLEVDGHPLLAQHVLQPAPFTPHARVRRSRIRGSIRCRRRRPPRRGSRATFEARPRSGRPEGARTVARTRLDKPPRPEHPRKDRRNGDPTPTTDAVASPGCGPAAGSPTTSPSPAGRPVKPRTRSFVRSPLSRRSLLTHYRKGGTRTLIPKP
jgi:hypothetical protein